MKICFPKNFVYFILNLNCISCNWIETPPWLDELFGDGDFNTQSTKLVAKHLSRQENTLKTVAKQGVNFINILCKPFPPIFLRQKITMPKCR